MRIYLTKFTVAIAIQVLGLGIAYNQAKASTLFIGPNGSFVQDIDYIHLITNRNLVQQAIELQQKPDNNLKRRQVKEKALINESNDIEAAKRLQKQLVNSNITKIQQSQGSKNVTPESFNAQSKTTKEIKELIKDIDAETINQDINDRYYGLVEDEEIGLVESNQLTKDLLENEANANAYTENILQENAELTQTLINSDQQETIDFLNTPEQNVKKELIQNSAKGIFLGLLLGGGAISLLALNGFKSAENRGIFGFISSLFGKTQIPDKAKELHNKTFKKAFSLGKKLERMDDEKFTSQEFILYLQLRNKINQGYRQKEPICLSIKYLEVGILAQSSFLRLEQTELRYRSRKQQDFYNFIAENITDDVDKKVFRDRIQDKLVEVTPKINTEEGKNALQSYYSEVSKISQYDLGLKLLSLFKKYQLTDFTILRRVSDIVEQASAESLMTDDNLKLVVLENYETLKKLAPIMEMDETEIKPQFFAKVLQYLALGRRHEKSFQEFQSLIKVLKQWETPYDSLKVIRQQYSNKEYSLPKEFYKEIPGLDIYRKYQEYLEKHR